MEPTQKDWWDKAAIILHPVGGLLIRSPVRRGIPASFAA